MPITHSKISLLSNNGDPNLVQPSDWNAAHVLSGTLDLTQTTGIVGGIIPNTALPFSSTPVFSVAQNASYSMLLTGNVTSSSTSGTPINGQLLSLTLTQDGVGGRTFIFPSNFVFSNTFAFITTANAINELTFKFDGTNWHQISNSGGSGGGGGSPAGNNGDLQQKSGSNFAASGLNDNGTLVKVARGMAIAGPDPVVDIREYGAYALRSQTTATTNSGSASVAVSSAQFFTNGEYVTVYNAGSACGLSTPSAPTVTPGVSTGGAFNVTGGVAGSNSNAYKIVAVSTTGCYTVASASGSTSAAPTLGMVGYSISSLAASNGTATITTTSAHSFIVGQMIYVQYGAVGNVLFEGWFAVATVPDSTHFTYSFPGDTRVAAPPSAAVVAQPTCTVTNTVLSSNIATVTCANSFTSGPAIPVIISGSTNGGGIFNGSFQTTALSATQFSFYLAHANVTSAADTGTTTIPGVWGFNVNALTWPAVTNAFKYFVYGRDGGNFNLIGQTVFPAWNDYGFQMESGQTFPLWAPTTAPAASGNNHLTAQILSGGGTTTLGLSVSAGANTSGVTIQSDDGPALIAALNAAKGQDQYCAPVLIPNATGIGSFGITIASFTDTTSTNCPSGTLLVQGGVTLRDTLKIGGLAVKGTAGSTLLLAFGQLSNGPAISVQAYPGIWMPGSGSQGVHFENLLITSFGANGTNNDLQIYNQGLLDTFDYVNWGHMTGGPLSISQIIDATVAGFTYKFDHNNFEGGYYGNLGFSPYGSMILTSFSGGAGSGLLQVSHSWFETKAGFDMEQIVAAGGGTFLFKDIATESHTYPVLVLSGPSLPQNIGNSVDIDGAFVADTPVALVAVLSNAQLTNASFRQAACGTNGNCNTGTPLVGLSQTSLGNAPQRLFSEEQFGSKFLLDGIFNTSQPGQMGMKRFNELVTIPSAFSLTTTVPAPAVPTCSVSSGGSIPTGTWQFILIPVWWNGAEGTQSGFSAGCTTTTGNQTITVNWTLIPGVLGYDLYHCQNFTSCFGVKNPPIMYPGTQTSVVITAFGGSSSQTSDPAGGPTTITGANVATQNLLLRAANSAGTATINVPSLTGDRLATLPDTSGTIAILPAGQVFSTASGTLGVTSGNISNIDNIVLTRGDGSTQGAAVTGQMVTDYFNRAANPITTNAPWWTQVFNGFTLSSSGAAGTTAAAQNYATYTGVTFPNDDQTVCARHIQTGSLTTQNHSLTLRGSATAQTAYQLALVSGLNSISLTKVVAGAFTALATQSTGDTTASGDLICFNAVGGASTVLTGYWNGKQVIQFTDSSSPLTSGSPGLWAFSTGNLFWKDFMASPGGVSLAQPQTWSALQTFTPGVVIGSSPTLSAVSGNTNTIALSSGTLPSGNLAKFDANHNIVDSGIVAGTNISLSALTAATASNSINNGDNAQTWNWALTTAGKTAFRFTENTAATGGNQFLLQAGTIIGSTAIPLNVYNNLNGSQTLAALSVTPTWNTTGVVDAALLVNPTNTASGTGSLLADFQLSSTSQWKVDKAGNTTQLGTSAVGSTPPACTPGTAGGSCLNEGTAPTAGSNYDTLYGDSGQHAATVNNNNTGAMAISRVTCVNVTGVTVSASVTTDQNLMSCTLAANLLNVVGRTLKIWTSSLYTTPAASVATLTQKIKLCTVSGCGSGTTITLASYTSSANAGSVTNNQLNTNTYSTTQTSGASSAYEAHGNMVIDLGASPTVADSTFADTNASTVGSIDSTGQLFLQVTGAFSAASGSNSWTQRQMLVEVLN